MEKTVFKEKTLKALKHVLPSTLKTALWIAKITVAVSFCIMLLRYFGVLPFISELLSPLFSHLGLPGEAALAYVTGYFVNVYSAIAVAVTIGLDWRSMTILGVMVLCAHNMIVETAVQKKTGSPAVRIVLVRTLSSILLPFVLNLLLPGSLESVTSAASQAEAGTFWEQFLAWGGSTLLLVPKIILIIFALNIIQALLAEFGLIRHISNFFRPLMRVFGIPARCSLLWLIANIVGLAYGAAAMIEEAESGHVGKEDIDLLNTHVAICHSNLEDVILLASIGAVWWVLLFSRMIMAIILVWCMRLEKWIRNKFLTLQVD